MPLPRWRGWASSWWPVALWSSSGWPGLGRRDLPWETAAVIANLGHRVTKGYWEHPSPTVWPPPHTYRQIRALAGETLPGVTIPAAPALAVLPGLGQASVIGPAAGLAMPDNTRIYEGSVDA